MSFQHLAEFQHRPGHGPLFVSQASNDMKFLSLVICAMLRWRIVIRSVQNSMKHYYKSTDLSNARMWVSMSKRQLSFGLINLINPVDHPVSVLCVVRSIPNVWLSTSQYTAAPGSGLAWLSRKIFKAMAFWSSRESLERRNCQWESLPSLILFGVPYSTLNFKFPASGHA